MMTLPYTQRIDPFLAVHAGVCPLSHDCPSGTPDAFHEAVFTSIRFVDSSWHPVQLNDSQESVVPWYEIYDGRLGIVVFGHHPYFDEVESVRIAPHAVGLDSGCWFSGRLSALVVNADGSTKVVSTVS
jgi:hypothetical protein